MTSAYAGKKFTRADALRLENANDEIQALKNFIADRSVAYEELLELKVNTGYGRRVDPFHVETQINNAGVSLEVFRVEVSGGNFSMTRFVPVEFVFSDGEFEKKYREVQEMLSGFAPVSK